MAPFVGPSRDQLLKLLAAWKPKLPITLGHMEPQATVTCDGGTWRIVELAMDRQAARRAGEAALARHESWMPEHTWQSLAPARVLVEATTKEDFVAKIRAMRWTFSG